MSTSITNLAIYGDLLTKFGTPPAAIDVLAGDKGPLRLASIGADACDAVKSLGITATASTAPQTIADHRPRGETYLG